MKKVKMVYGWILFSVIVQFIVLSYLNFIYLPGRGAVKATLYEEDAVQIKNRSMKLPKDVKDVTVSFDGLYTAWISGNKLVISDVVSGKTIKELSPPGGSFTFFRWLPDRDMLIYSIKEPDNKKGRVRISTYDIGPELERSYPDIKGLPEGSETIDIELSPLTNVVYPMIKTSETRARIYKFDIMDNLSLIMKTDLTTVIKETMYSDRLIYQTSDGKIKIRNGKNGKTSLIPVKNANLLLEVDDRDFIYAAITDDRGEITEIYFGKEGQEADEWSIIKPDKPLNAEDIFVTPRGAIYANDIQKREVYALDGTETAGYSGNLLTVLDDYVVSVDGDKLVFIVLKK
mgnify:CR=1 FL=1